MIVKTIMLDSYVLDFQDIIVIIIITVWRFGRCYFKQMSLVLFIDICGLRSDDDAFVCTCIT